MDDPSEEARGLSVLCPPRCVSRTARLALTLALLGAAGCAQTTTDYFWENAMGCASAGIVTHSSFVGDSMGIEPGAGWTVTLPPLLPVIVGACVLDPLGTAFGAEDGSPEIFRLATVSGVQDTFYDVIAELSLEVTFSEGWHDDARYGGHVNHESWFFGVRLGGPQTWRPSYSLAAGWALHTFECDSRLDSRVQGPYLGAALQFFFTREVKLLLEFRRQFFTTDRSGGPVADGARQGVVAVTGSWYF